MTAAPPPSTKPKPLSGPQKALRKLGLVRPIDLALHLPLRYEDETRITKLRDVREGEVAQIEGVVTVCEVKITGHRQLLVTVDDGTDTCMLRFFSFYPSHQKALAVGNRIRARGEIRGGFAGLQMMHPAFKAADGELAVALTPVYPTVAGLPQAYLRRAVQGGLARAELSDTLLPETLDEIGLQPLWNMREVLSFLHNPTPDVALATLEDHSHPAWQRLKAEELLAQQLSQLQSKRERDKLRAPVLATRHAGRPHAGPGPLGPGHQSDQCLPLHEQLLAALPFQLTAAQRRVGEEIMHDLARPVPMHRLLQGDVGSGKTVVAALAAAICIDAGWQCALMAPTEILATQHFGKLVSWLEPLGIKTAWLTGSQKIKERREMLALIASGEAGLVIGTHAIIQEKVLFKNLALAIIDEQHRFGVAQRLALRSKLTPQTERPEALATPRDELPEARVAGSGFAPAQPTAGPAETLSPLEPHLLMMTATPIPRTLAMSYYADLDVSTIDELPPGRTPIITKVVNEARRDEVIARIRVQLAEGRQIYWVCPLIEESEALDLSNATETHAQLSAALPGVMVGLLHSRMPVAEKKAVMALFSSGQMGLLVSTTVIEVGVDVPNASLMVIEHAERFGLSQLHQLRGRVGRGAAASACVLLYSTGDAPRLGETARARLKAMAETNDGFEIARRDLEIRGPGEFLGARQSGAALLRFADLTLDAHLLAWAREVAPLMLDHYPALAQKHVTRWLGDKTDYLKA
ncbi:ATP-dependent DNA helicase RecG [Rhodoferax sp.]|uniref:ATP-dependent DNA helicase RecG n=1 Tax=Rhodoferax sp. TaxID=50421 RepID=UPI0025D1BEA4|nr:ATP-dependent DNA helicase RecG [Rhodoferax sp.]